MYQPLQELIQPKNLPTRFSSSQRTQCLNYKDQPVNAVWGIKHSLFWELYRTHYGG